MSSHERNNVKYPGDVKEAHYDLCIIGAGMAGMAAALFASGQGYATALCGSVGGIDFSSGPLDLLAVHPVAEKRVWDDPWAALEALIHDAPEHPYAKVGLERIRTAMDIFCAGLAEMGLPYEGGERNARMLTPAGTLKRTYRVPRSMWNGVTALDEKTPCLVVGFKGLKGFSSHQIATVQGAEWPGLRSVQLPFPRFRGELYAEHLAVSLNEPEMVHALARAVIPHLREARCVAFPSVLGLYGAGHVQERLEGELGLKVFEIPTLPPSLTGLRLRGVFEEQLPHKGVTVFSQKLATHSEFLPDGRIRLAIAGQGEDASQRPECTITARAVIHAGGRFFGKGLSADRTGVREPLMGLPVRQPEGRDAWHELDFFAPSGHAVNMSGLETDERLRPLGKDGKPAHETLFAAGSILAHQDWMRAKCGAGLAIATAYLAVEEASRVLR